MCGRVFQTYNVNQLLRAAGTALMRQGQPNRGMGYNRGPTHYLPAIRQYNQNVSNINQIVEHDFSDNNQVNDAQLQQQQQQQIQEETKQQQENCNQQISEELLQKNNYRFLDFMKWGYETKFNFIINARVEEMNEKYTFKPLLNKNRCIIIVNGYYEWNPKKVPYIFRPKKDTRDYFLIAAVYGPNDELIVLTRGSNAKASVVHHRMPVLLEEDEIDIWLNVEKYSFNSILDKIILNEKKEVWDVEYEKAAPYVSSIKNQGEQCMMTLAEYEKQQDKIGIKKFFKTNTGDKTDNQITKEKQNSQQIIKNNNYKITQQNNIKIVEKSNQKKEPINKSSIENFFKKSPNKSSQNPEKSNPSLIKKTKEMNKYEYEIIDSNKGINNNILDEKLSQNQNQKIIKQENKNSNFSVFAKKLDYKEDPTILNAFEEFLQSNQSK